MNQKNFLKRVLFRVFVKMFASTFLSFAVVFLLVSVVGLLIQLIPYILLGRIDIDPLPIFIVSFTLAFAIAGLRIVLMKRFSKIRI